MRLFGHRPAQARLSVVIPTELGEADFLTLFPAMDEYEPGALVGWLSWEESDFWQRLRRIGSFLFGVHHRFEMLLRQLGLSSEEIRLLRALIQDYFRQPKHRRSLDTSLRRYLKKEQAVVADLQRQLLLREKECDEAIKAVLVTKIILEESAMTAASRAEETRRVLLKREAALKGVEQQLARLPTEAGARAQGDSQAKAPRRLRKPSTTLDQKAKTS